MKSLLILALLALFSTNATAQIYTGGHNTGSSGSANGGVNNSTGWNSSPGSDARAYHGSFNHSADDCIGNTCFKNQRKVRVVYCQSMNSCAYGSSSTNPENIRFVFPDGTTSLHDPSTNR